MPQAPDLVASRRNRVTLDVTGGGGRQHVFITVSVCVGARRQLLIAPSTLAARNGPVGEARGRSRAPLADGSAYTRARQQCKRVNFPFRRRAAGGRVIGACAERFSHADAERDLQLAPVTRYSPYTRIYGRI